MAKEMTHAGMVQLNRHDEPHEVMLRETPKFWTNGTTRWPKFNMHGELTRFSYARGSCTFSSHTLDLTSIRPLTVEDKRLPLQQAVKHSVSYIERLETELASLQVKLAEAHLSRADRVKALEKFNEKHKEGDSK